jgi:light-regulated signal transduction histidine kinase (bacteriophytochrome)
MTAQAQTPETTDCEREPIHIPGSIQPHGVLLALRRPDLAVVHASVNGEAAFGQKAGALIGQRLEAVSQRLHRELADDLSRLDENAQPHYLRTLALATPEGSRIFDTVAHLSSGLLILEMEEVSESTSASMDALYPSMRGFVEALRNAETIEDLCATAATNIRRITGFDRVLVYQFDPQWNGTVVAEDRNDVLPSYLDLRFPASDIPAQARELYRRNRLRIIPDAGYRPVPIVPTLDPKTGLPLDLSQSILRSVSPVHVEYMHNMGTLASMSISILRDGHLWGLISCHSRNPQRVPLQVRNACDFLTEIFSMQLAARENAIRAEYQMRLGAVQARLLAHMAEEERFIDGLVTHPSDLMHLSGAAGVAVISGDHSWLAGVTPSEAQIRDLFEWLSVHHREDVFATDSLRETFPASDAYADVASGLLAISISKMHASYVLWFRPEVVQTVRWGGDPQKPMERTEDGPGRLHPRKSFETWKETVRGHSVPWQEAEIEAAKELRNAVVGIVLRRAEELAALNDELRRSNKELEAFSYSVSHDLRAPFRHIVGYSELLKKHEGERLGDRSRRYIDTIIESALTAGTLVDNLLSFSQMGRTALKLRRVDMTALAKEVRQRADLDAEGRSITWRIHDLAPVTADPIMMRLVFENLFSNAIKYTRGRDQAVIDVGWRLDDNENVYWVRDNGIGFDMAYVGKLFGVFQRLHRIEEFEGTGIGLANVRRIVERHGGRTWAEGAIDQGATIFFTLPAMEPERNV